MAEGAALLAGNIGDRIEIEAGERGRDLGLRDTPPSARPHILVRM
jgi:hypothetical protein